MGKVRELDDPVRRVYFLGRGRLGADPGVLDAAEGGDGVVLSRCYRGWRTMMISDRWMMMERIRGVLLPSESGLEEGRGELSRVPLPNNDRNDRLDQLSRRRRFTVLCCANPDSIAH